MGRIQHEGNERSLVKRIRFGRGRRIPDAGSTPGGGGRNGQPWVVYHASLVLSCFRFVNELRHDRFEREILERDHRIRGEPPDRHHRTEFRR